MAISALALQQSPWEGGSYLKNYGLPREIGGNFICENGKPKLPY
ncbi:hypothetical protein [Pelistega suis]|nr:hypothetical protein [Pelistega suis]